MFNYVIFSAASTRHGLVANKVYILDFESTRLVLIRKLKKKLWKFTKLDNERKGWKAIA